MALSVVGDGDVEFKFEGVRLFKNQTLGTGSYGAVCKAKCDELPCAAKLLYPVLFDLNITPQEAQPGREQAHRQPQRRFEAECRFLSQIKHPNIVQSLGMYRDPETNALVLLMELMDESLTHFLETPQNSIELHMQVNILHDTALALAFLHYNGITHRDLSSNNVLLIAKSRAKVTDFGMSKFASDRTSCLASITQCPGTPAYMPPEALDEPPVYSEKLDCFSYGVLIVQTITREFPKPTDRFQLMNISHPTQPSLMVQARILVPEQERRQSHINLIPTTHPLKSIAFDCLKERDVDRPTAQQLCERVEQLKTTPLYASSIHQARDRDLLLQAPRETSQDKQADEDQQKSLLTIVEQEVLQLRQENQQLRRKNEQLPSQLQQLQQEVQQLRQHLQSSEELVADLQLGTTDKDIQIQQLQMQIQQLYLEQQPQPETELRLTWRKGTKAPFAMSRGSSAVVGNTVYVIRQGSEDINAFHYITSQWSTLPRCPYTRRSTLTNINGMLTTVGGLNAMFKCTNKLMTFRNQKWEELYPQMPSVRASAAVLSTITHLLVIGGNGVERISENTEILNIETNQWSSACPVSSRLEYPITKASVTQCGKSLYLMGGCTPSEHLFSVFRCHLEDLVTTSTPSDCSSTALVAHSQVWHRLPDLPVRTATCVTVQGHVLAIGGKESQGKISSFIYRYDQERNLWIVVNNNMIDGRLGCLAVVLPDNKILVVGGWNDNGETGETEIATVTTLPYQIASIYR